jgi:RNA polymerase sigma factor (sigma-70 family)
VTVIDIDARGQAAFVALYQQTYGRVLRYAARRVGQGSDAEDVAAEVFRIAWARAAAGTTVGTGWLFVTTDNVLRNHHRSERRAQRLTLAAADGQRTAGTAAADERVLDVLDGLDEPTRTLLVLRYWDELSGAEIGEVLGLSASAVWVRLHRARKAFTSAYEGVS